VLLILESRGPGCHVIGELRSKGKKEKSGNIKNMKKKKFFTSNFNLGGGKISPVGVVALEGEFLEIFSMEERKGPTRKKFFIRSISSPHKIIFNSRENAAISFRIVKKKNFLYKFPFLGVFLDQEIFSFEN
jgi:hypothetical protein